MWRLFYAAYSSVVLHLFRSIQCFYGALCVVMCVRATAHFFYIASIHSWENLMCYSMIFIQIHCVENINSADYDWLMIMLDCVFVCLFVGMYGAGVPMHLWLGMWTRARVQFYRLHFSRARVQSGTLIFTAISDIDIGCWEISLFRSLFSSSVQPPANWKQIKGHTVEN